MSNLLASLIRLEEVWTQFKVNDHIKTDAHLCSTHPIRVTAFLEREELIRKRKQVDRRAEVLEFGDDEATEYVMLSHWWVRQEVDHDKIVELAKTTGRER